MIRTVVRRLFLFCIGILMVGGFPSAFTSAQNRLYDDTEVRFVAWNPDGSVLAAGFQDQILILDAQTLSVLNTFQTSDRLFSSPVWSTDGKLLAFGNSTNVEIWRNVWNPVSAIHVATLEHDENGFGAISAIGWSPDGKQLATANGYYTKIWDTNTWRNLKFLGGEWDVQRYITWSPSGDRFASAVSGGGIGIWKAQSYELVISLNLRESYGPDDTILYPSPNSIVWSPDGQYLLIGSEDGILRIFDTTPTDRVIRVEDDTSVTKIHARSDGIRSVAWRPGSTEVASSSLDGTIKIWDTQTLKLKETIQIERPGDFWSIAWSPDGAKLAYGTPDRSVKIIEITAFDDSSDVPKASG